MQYLSHWSETALCFSASYSDVKERITPTKMPNFLRIFSLYVKNKQLVPPTLANKEKDKLQLKVTITV